ncbi:MAG: hypothetical protein KGH58_02980 [Candidatus Micrarchaeota archaeon]|nr:hypothetical protein [Candidatus Micrarchaeota archaeon]
METQKEVKAQDVEQIRVASAMEFAQRIKNFIAVNRGGSENSAHMILTLRGRKYAGFYPAEKYNNQTLVVPPSSLSYSALVDMHQTYIDRDEKRAYQLRRGPAPKPKPIEMPMLSVFYAIKGGAEVDIVLRVREKAGSSYTRHAHVGFGSEVGPRHTDGNKGGVVLRLDGPIGA